MMRFGCHHIREKIIQTTATLLYELDSKSKHFNMSPYDYKRQMRTLAVTFNFQQNYFQQQQLHENELTIYKYKNMMSRDYPYLMISSVSVCK